MNGTNQSVLFITNGHLIVRASEGAPNSARERERNREKRRDGWACTRGVPECCELDGLQPHKAHLVTRSARREDDRGSRSTWAVTNPATQHNKWQ